MTQLSGNCQHWLTVLGNFGITAKGDEIKGTLAADWGEDGTVYFNDMECQEIAAAFSEVAKVLAAKGE